MHINLTRPLVVFDLETTGVIVGRDRIVEISMVKVLPDQSTETRTHRINPGVSIPEEVTKIHGISNEDVKDCPSFKDLAPEINRFLNNCDLAGFNSLKFDFPLLVEEFLRANLEFDMTNRKLLDVQNIFHKMEQRTLAAAYKFYCGKELVNAHSAEADTLATLEVLKAQIAKYENTEFEDKNGKVSKPVQNDIQALHDFSIVHKHADLVGHIIFNENGTEVINFGKHKGKAVEEIFQAEPSYYDWMMRSDFPLSTKKLITQIKLRGFNKNSVNIQENKRKS